MTDCSTPENNRRAPTEHGWHLDKKVPLSLILAMVIQVVVVTMFFADIKKDVELLKADNITLHKADEVASNVLRETAAAMNSQLSRIDMKLDRLIERSRR